MIAFLTSVTEKAGIKARYLHQGMTSSDVLDTSLNIQLVQSGKILLGDIDQILKVLKKQAKNTNTPLAWEEVMEFMLNLSHLV